MSSTIRKKNSISDYLSLVKFSHTLFALPFALFGFTLGLQQNNYIFDWKLFLCVLLCMVFARNAAMSYNRYLDRHFDAKNPRTANREIPAGIISAKNALTFVILNCILFVATTYFINNICLYLSPIALFVILFYSYTKRITPLCHIVLGLGLGLAPIGSYLAVTDQFDWAPIILSLGVMTWTGGFDIIYAMQDEDFDRNMQLYSIPSFFGGKKALYISSFLHILTFICMLLVGILGDFHWIFYIGLSIFTYLLIYQHTIVKHNDLTRVNVAFVNTNSIGSITFSLIAIIAILLQ